MASTLRTLTRLPRHLSRRRAFSTCPRLLQQSPFGSGPAPPRLPKSEQEIFEKLQRQSTGAGAPPEFEGDVNPKTGEVGGPKNEPLR
ncbi:hypothetical protein PtrSN002B_005058 [Pyrenophora tritici-repentis]|nr:hypothetical protein A1F94_006129 [Pyrenophora tritici-repentis]KAI1538486.1 hypothetical protein PtrSN001A_004936 [Pyrenophora tritici-repentis]KAI1540705.1 hypothetical protein PtrSN001C_004835 [Pyrenophora tritici-repentis]KAI1552648.1 hypothetical protein PtrSN002B_005058 [Pyrenophora tritici-repentis]KAI1590947.1 hypothetical protein PtrEW13061_005020 [Pyrenophora tritici-repentis]